MAFIPGLPALDPDDTPPSRRSAGRSDALERPDPPPGPATTGTHHRRSGGRSQPLPDVWSFRAYWEAPVRVTRIRHKVMKANNHAFRNGAPHWVTPSGKTMADLSHPIFAGKKWNKLRKELAWLAARLGNKA